MKKIWYAVMKDHDDDDWGYGSYDYEEAKQMLMDLESPDACIAVIDNTDDDPMCIREIEFYYWVDPNAGQDYWHNDCFAMYRDERGSNSMDTADQILKAAYVDLPGYEEAVHTYIDAYGQETKEVDAGKVEELLDAYIEKKLGFLPDYEIG